MLVFGGNRWTRGVSPETEEKIEVGDYEGGKLGFDGGQLCFDEANVSNESRHKMSDAGQDGDDRVFAWVHVDLKVRTDDRLVNLVIRV